MWKEGRISFFFVYYCWVNVNKKRRFMKKKSFWKFFSNSSWKTYIILWLKMWFSCHQFIQLSLKQWCAIVMCAKVKNVCTSKNSYILFIFKTSLKCHHLSNSLFKRFFHFRLCHKNLHNHHFGELCEKFRHFFVSLAILHSFKSCKSKKFTTFGFSELTCYDFNANFR